MHLVELSVSGRMMIGEDSQQIWTGDMMTAGICTSLAARKATLATRKASLACDPQAYSCGPQAVPAAYKP